EIASAEKLLNWGFATGSKVRPVGVLVPPLSQATSAARRAGTAHVATGHLAAAATHTARPATARPATARSATDSDSRSDSGLLAADTGDTGVNGASGAARIAGAPYSYALTGQAWLRRARLIAGHRPG